MSLRSKGRKHSDETKKKMSEIAKFRHKDSIIKAGAIATAKNRKTFSEKPWLNPNADLTVWAKADQVYQIYLKNPEVGIRTLGSILQIPFSKFQRILKRIISGWIPNKCPFWIKTFIFNKESK